MTATGRSETLPAATPADGAQAAQDADALPEASASGPHVVYCGGCNPHIDRGAIASELVAAPTFVRPGSLVYLSGCQRACASDHQMTTDEPDAVVVAGAHVDGAPTPPQDIAAAVADKLKE